MAIQQTVLADGKYTVLFNDETGEQWALRYGEQWDIDLTGNKLVLALCQRIQELESEVAELEDYKEGVQNLINWAEQSLELAKSKLSDKAKTGMTK